MVGHRIHAVCPDKKKGDRCKTSVHAMEGDQTYVERPGHNFMLHREFDKVDPEDYEGLILTGGRGAEYLRLNERVLEVVKHFLESNKPICSIGHGVQLLTPFSDLIKDRRISAYPGC